MNKLTKLFEPIKVGSMELKNRIVWPALGLNYCPDGQVNERLKSFYAQRAEGGAALLILNSGAYRVFRPPTIRIDHDRYLPGLRELTGVVHRGGAKIAAQIAVRPNWARDGDTAAELRGPSDVPASRGGEGPRPRPLSVEEIHQAVQGMGEATRRAREAGFDAVEVHANVGTCLVSHFLSPFTNKRTDAYGGSLENRYRILLEIIGKAKEMAGRDYPVLCRLSGSDFMDGGAGVEDTVLAAPLLEKAGLDCLDVTTGWHESPVPFFQMGIAPGVYVYLAEAVKKAVTIPVMGGTKISDPFLAEEALARGGIDLVFIGRGLIADPQFPNKAREGRYDDIRPCISCCLCFERTMAGNPMACSVNAQAGREEELKLRPAATPKRVLVVGGGPAGLQAATAAAQRGYSVTLVEKAGRLGGNLLLATLPPNKKELVPLVNHLTSQARKAGIRVQLNTVVDATSVLRRRPDAVILAPGASPIIPDIPGVTGANVVTAPDVLTGKAKTGQRVVIAGGGMIGCETAEFLAQQGKTVTILEMLPRVGEDIGRATRWVVMQRLRTAKVGMETRAKVEGITDKGVRASRDNQGLFFPADTVVIAVGMKPNRELAQALQGKVPELHIIGDGMEPRRIAQAAEEGMRAALAI